jgi:hypothetical protein
MEMIFMHPLKIPEGTSAPLCIPDISTMEIILHLYVNRQNLEQNKYKTNLHQQFINNKNYIKH